MRTSFLGVKLETEGGGRNFSDEKKKRKKEKEKKKKRLSHWTFSGSSVSPMGLFSCPKTSTLICTSESH